MGKVDLDEMRYWAKDAADDGRKLVGGLIAAAADELAQLRAEVAIGRERLGPAGWRLLQELVAARDCVACLEHAVEMGHFTEGGSTEKWAKSALAAYARFTRAGGDAGAKVGGQGK